jgi:hypothetical protein
MQFQCPHCRAIVEAREDQAGQVIKCDACGGQMQLPAAAPAPAPAPRQPEVIRPDYFPGGSARPGQPRCPHCGEDVVGNESRCPHCGTWFDESKKGAMRIGPDWERRDRLGWWPAFWNTFKSVMFAPVRTFEGMRTDGYAEAFKYSLAANYIGITAAVIWQALFQGAQMMLVLGSRSGGSEAGVMMAVIVVIFVVALALGAPIASAMTFVVALFYHLGLMIFGGAKKPYETTYRVVAYCSGAASLFNVVPICGGHIGGIWGLVATIIGLAKAHETDYWRSALGVLMWIALVFLLAIGVAVVFFAALAAS